MSDLLPECMAPDGAEPCKAFQQQHAEIERLRDALINAASRFTDPKFGVNWTDAANDIYRLLDMPEVPYPEALGDECN